MVRDKQARRRKMIQALGALTFNGHLSGFLEGRIYTGAGKSVCVPVLNCYSCPGAWGACPVGSLQSAAGNGRFSLSTYVLGLMVLFGILGGRIFCGYLCPFGLFQELLHRIPLRKWTIPIELDRWLRRLKYAILLFPVILLPILFRDAFGIKTPYFCAWLCPAGTLEAGLPLLAANPVLRNAAGGQFIWKLFLLALVIYLSIRLFRVFCRYACPLGAFLGLFNGISWYHLRVDQVLCTQCKTCAKTCPMGLDPSLNPNSPECIRCHTCLAVCPEDALHSQVGVFLEADARE